MSKLTQPKFIQISNDKYYLFALDEEGNAWKYYDFGEKDSRTGWRQLRSERHAPTS